MSDLQKNVNAYKNITEAADILEVQPYVLRFWEAKFPQISPLKLAGKRRYYSPEDIELLNSIKKLLYKEGYTIKGVQNLIERNGVKAINKLSQEESLLEYRLTTDNQNITEIRDIEDGLQQSASGLLSGFDSVKRLEEILSDIESIEEKLQRLSDNEEK